MQVDEDKDAVEALNARLGSAQGPRRANEVNFFQVPRTDRAERIMRNNPRAAAIVRVRQK